MHTKKRKFTAILLVLAMLFTLMPALPQAAEAGNQEYVSLEYDKGAMKKHITVNVNINGKTEQTIEVKDAAAADNQIEVSLLDTTNYEIAGRTGVNVSVSGLSAVPDFELSSDLSTLKLTWNSGIGDDLTIDVTLRSDKMQRPTISDNGIYEGSATIGYRLYDSQIIKMLALAGEDVAARSTIERVKVNFIGTTSLGLSPEMSDTNRENDYYYFELSNVDMKASPNNVESIEIKYDGKTVIIPAGDLLFDWHQGVGQYYSIESNNAEKHIVWFYNENGSATANDFYPWDYRIVDHGKSLGTNMPEDPVYNDSISNEYKFVNWEIGSWTGDSKDGETFLSTTIVDKDLTVYAHKVSSKLGGTQIHILNNESEFLKRVAEKYNEEHNTTITVSDIKTADTDGFGISVFEYSGRATTPRYLDSGWFDSYGYYAVRNYDAESGTSGETYNQKVSFDQVAGIRVEFKINGENDVKSVEIPVGNYPGDLAKLMGDGDNLLQLYVIQPGDVIDDPDDNKPEPPDDDTLLELLKNAVTINCTNDAVNHQNETYDLLAESYDRGTVQGNDQDGYTFTVTVHPDKYVAEYNKDQSVTHQLDPDTQVPKEITLNMAPGSSAWTVAEKATPVTFTVKCDDPMPATYSLKYDANGGDPDSVPVDTKSYKKDQVVTLSSQVPTHAKKDGKDVVFIGWSMKKPTKDVYAAGEDYGSLVDKVTFDDNSINSEGITVYAVWGYDEYGNGSEGGDKIPDAQQVVITPADITVYTGGTGYTGVLDDNSGEGLGTTENGLPEPGYYFILPYELNEQFGQSPDQMVNLSKHLRLDYENNGDKRSWILELYNSKADENENIANERYVYRLVPDGETKSARLEIHDVDTNTSITSDHFKNFNLNTLYKEYAMNLYTDTVERNLVKVSYTVNGTDWTVADDIKGLALDTGKLTVRGTTDQEHDLTSSIQSEVTDKVNNITASDLNQVIYYTNGSIIPVVNQDSVKLLVDEVVENAQGKLKDAIVDAAEKDESITIDKDYTFDFNYLDLVDTSNGNAYVTMGKDQTMTLFWPYPDNMDASDTYYIAHFNGLDRNYDDLDKALEDQSTTLDIYSTDNKDLKLEKTDEGIKITTSSFSPFALVYDADQGSGGNTGGGGGTTPNPPDLNTEDHFSYVVGYEDGMVKPENAITRAEVASIFYRLLKDEVRDENTTDVSEFSDVSASDWYGTTVATLSAMDIVRGYEDGTFRPNAPITRAEFAAIATRFFEETGAEYEPGTFDDVTGDEWFANAIADAVELGLIGGYPDGTVRPNNNITRAEACAVVNRTLGRIPHVDHLLPADEMTTWPDNNPSDWFYADMQEATNGHEYEWTKEDGQKVEEWTEILDKDWEDR